MYRVTFRFVKYFNGGKTNELSTMDSFTAETEEEVLDVLDTQFMYFSLARYSGKPYKEVTDVIVRNEEEKEVLYKVYTRINPPSKEALQGLKILAYNDFAQMYRVEQDMHVEEWQ